LKWTHLQFKLHPDSIRDGETSVICGSGEEEIVISLDMDQSPFLSPSDDNMFGAIPFFVNRVYLRHCRVVRLGLASLWSLWTNNATGSMAQLCNTRSKAGRFDTYFRRQLRIDGLLQGVSDHKSPKLLQVAHDNEAPKEWLIYVLPKGKKVVEWRGSDVRLWLVQRTQLCLDT
jgi:hypothetical protein